MHGGTTSRIRTPIRRVHARRTYKPGTRFENCCPRIWRTSLASIAARAIQSCWNLIIDQARESALTSATLLAVGSALRASCLRSRNVMYAVPIVIAVRLIDGPGERIADSGSNPVPATISPAAAARPNKAGERAVPSSRPTLPVVDTPELVGRCRQDSPAGFRFQSWGRGGPSPLSRMRGGVGGASRQDDQRAR